MMRIKRPACLLACLCLTLLTLFLSTASAQVNFAELIGRVTDPQGAVVPNAAVKAVDQLKGTTLNTNTVPDGTYTLPSIPPGLYRLEVTMTGFQTAVVPNLDLSPGVQKRVDVNLVVGAVTQTVTVTDVAPAIETQRPDVTQRMGRHVMNRPMTNDVRGWVITALSWLPDSATSGAAAWVSFGHAIKSQQAWIIDGASVASHHTALPEAAVSEMQVTTSMASAEFSRPVNVQVDFRGGTNAYHGSIEWGLKNSAFNNGQ